MHRTAAGERLLTTVENHHYNLAFSCYSDTGTGVTLGVIRAACGSGHIFTVANKPLRTRRSLPNGAFTVFINIFAEILRVVDNGSLSVFQDGEEVIIT